MENVALAEIDMEANKLQKSISGSLKKDDVPIQLSSIFNLLSSLKKETRRLANINNQGMPRPQLSSLS